MIEHRQKRLVEALGGIRRRTFRDPTLHFVDPALGLERVAAGKKTGQSRMGHGDMQPIAVIVGDILPVHAAWTKCDAALRPQDRKSTRLNSSHMSISYAVF